MTTSPSSESSEATWSRRVLMRLDDVDREKYEQLCDLSESHLSSGRSPHDIALAINRESPVRDLVLLNLGKCLIEQIKSKPTVEDIEAIILELDSLGHNGQAQDEFRKHSLADKLIVSNGAGDASADSIPPSHEFISRISSNGFAQVFLVRRKSLSRVECLKAVQLANANHPELAARVKDEALRASKLTHPGLVQVFDAGTHKGCEYICMEYMNGGSLADRLATGPIPWQIAVRLMATAARALEALHCKASLAHGDIKPANLLFNRIGDDDEVFKIGDFGLSSELAVEASRNGDGQFAFGTPGYLAPELLRRENADAALIPFNERVTADIFALGVTAYEAISGRLPFQKEGGVDPFGPVNNQYTSLSDLVPTIPPVVAYVVKRACSLQRMERFASAKEFARALEQCVTENNGHMLGHALGPKSASEPSPIPPSTTPARATVKNTTTWLTAITSVVLAMLCLAYLLPTAPIPGESNPRGPNSAPQGPASPPRPTNRPTKADQSDLVVLKSRGLPQEAARAIQNLNSDWLESLRAGTGTVGIADEMLTLLAQSNESRIGSSTLASMPHFAPLSAFPGIDSHSTCLEGLLSGVEHSDVSYVNLLLQFPFPQADAKYLDRWVRYHDSLAALMQHGLYGADRIMLVAADDTPVLHAWVDDILVKKVSERPDRAEQWIAIFLEQHDAVRLRLADDSFRQRFLQTTWPRFVKMVESQPGLAEDFALDSGVWDVLSIEEGAALLGQYGLLPVAMLTGRTSFPADGELRASVIGHLKVGYEPIVLCFADRDLRANPGFCNLIRMRLPSDVFAVVCDKARSLKESGKHAAYIETTSQKSRERLIADITGVDVNRWPIEGIVPQAIYIRVGLKIVGGESLYDAERQAFIRQLAIDAVTYVLPAATSNRNSRLYVPPEQMNSFVQTFPKGYDIGQCAVRELMRQEQLKALVKFGKEPGAIPIGEIEAGRNLASEMRHVVRSISEMLAIGHQHEVLDVTNAKRLFEGLADSGTGKQQRVDLRKVRYLRLPDGRLFPGVVTTEGVFASPTVKKFFDDRWLALVSKDQSAEAKEIAWRQMVSAWLLLGATNQIPHTD